MKKLVAVTLSLLLCLSLFGCSAKSKDTNSVQYDEANAQTTTEAQSETVVDTSQSETVNSTEKETTTTNNSKEENSTIECTITIDCTNIMNNLSDEQKENISRNGTILTNYSVTVKNGTTIADALKQACNEKGIEIETKANSIDGVTISSINGIAENDFGKNSGWQFSKNSQKYRTDASSTVSDGDHFVFSYETKISK